MDRIDDRALSIHCARVYLAEARRRRRDPVSRKFYWTLLGWAADNRSRAMAIPVQRDMFGLREAA